MQSAIRLAFSKNISLLLPLLFVSAATVQAATSYDANLASPGGSEPGWYNGSGNPNGGFTVDTSNGIELGLRAKLRQSPNVIDSPNNVYNVPYGPQASSPSHAAWNYEFSIDLHPNGTGTLTFSDITATLTILDVTTGAHDTVNPLNYFPDDTGYGSSGKDSPETTTDWGAQNSENPIFASFPLASDYNEYAPRQYEFTLTVDQAGNPIASDTIFVNVGTPEPATFALMGSGLFLAGAFAKLRKRKA